MREQMIARVGEWVGEWVEGWVNVPSCQRVVLSPFSVASESGQEETEGSDEFGLEGRLARGGGDPGPHAGRPVGASGSGWLQSPLGSMGQHLLPPGSSLGGSAASSLEGFGDLPY